MRTAIALTVGWAIGFGGPALFPSTGWLAWVCAGSFMTAMIVWGFK